MGVQPAIDPPAGEPFESDAPGVADGQALPGMGWHEALAAQTGAAEAQVRRKIAILREVLARPAIGLVPQLSPFAALGHSYPVADRILGLNGGESRAALEELANLGLLRRHLHNKVHVCPKCQRCQVNFRETCPTCDSIELHIERLLHHFACAYIGLESGFADGLELRCPKCRVRLLQLGQDFERPHETYVCEQCDSTAESPVVGGQCLHCSHLFGVRDARQMDVFTYQATELTARAVELGRLTALQVADLLFDPQARLARMDYLVLEARREFARMRRHAVPTSLVHVLFHSDGEPFPLFHAAGEDEIRQLGRQLTESLRDLDLVAPAGPALLCLLLPETDEQGAGQVADRVAQGLLDLQLCDAQGTPLQVHCTLHCWQEAPADVEGAIALLRGESA